MQNKQTLLNDDKPKVNLIENFDGTIFKAECQYSYFVENFKFLETNFELEKIVRIKVREVALSHHGRCLEIFTSVCALELDSIRLPN